MRNIFKMLSVLAISFSLVTAHADEPAEKDPGGGAIVEFSGGVIQPKGTFTVLTYDAPYAIRLGDTGLLEAGLTAGGVIRKSDEIRIFESKEKQNASPLARIWFNADEGGAYWFHTGGEGAAADYIIPQGAMVVVWTRASTEPVSWANIFD